MHSLASALYGGKWSVSRPGRFIAREGGPQSRSGRGGEKKNSHPLPGVEAPFIQPVAQGSATELSHAA
jgi:hypothetical protein